MKLGPRPWGDRWERKNLKGVEDLGLPQRFYDRAQHPQIVQPWKKYDLMDKYRFVYALPSSCVGRISGRVDCEQVG